MNTYCKKRKRTQNIDNNPIKAAKNRPKQRLKRIPKFYQARNKNHYITNIKSSSECSSQNKSNKISSKASEKYREKSEKNVSVISLEECEYSNSNSNNTENSISNSQYNKSVSRKKKIINRTFNHTKSNFTEHSGSKNSVHLKPKNEDEVSSSSNEEEPHYPYKLGEVINGYKVSQKILINNLIK